MSVYGMEYECMADASVSVSQMRVSECMADASVSECIASDASD